uniref:Uncharacterized protein n=1 Tax=Rhodnius prolixus TaxID=13249 RepID=T1HVY4_RHOPR
MAGIKWTTIFLGRAYITLAALLGFPLVQSEEFYRRLRVQMASFRCTCGCQKL